MPNNTKIPNPEVKCIVNACTHWIPGNICSAGNINILNETENTTSKSKEETICSTFEKRQGLDGLIDSADNINWIEFAEELVGIGRQLNPTVTCIVDTCKYHNKDDLCQIDSIEITYKKNSEYSKSTNCTTFEYDGKSRKDKIFN